MGIGSSFGVWHWMLLAAAICAVAASASRMAYGNSRGANLVNQETSPLAACKDCGAPVSRLARACPHCGRPVVAIGRHSRVAAIVLALLLGGLGAHKFYLGQPVRGVVYLLFCWTLIPAFVALVEAMIFLASSDDAFARRYG